MSIYIELYTFPYQMSMRKNKLILYDYNTSNFINKLITHGTIKKQKDFVQLRSLAILYIFGGGAGI